MTKICWSCTITVLKFNKPISFIEIKSNQLAWISQLVKRALYFQVFCEDCQGLVGKITDKNDHECPGTQLNLVVEKFKQGDKTTS